MPARDYYHEVVRLALQKDGWTITHDPYRRKNNSTIHF
jgi:XisH protein